MNAIAMTAQTMTSREIAELADKNHQHVMRDIRTMLGELSLAEGGYVQNWTHPQNGRVYEEFALPKDLTITLVAGYSIVMRHRIVTRWQELEDREKTAGPALPDFTDPAAAAVAWAEQFRAKQALAIENAAQAEHLAIAAPKAAALDLISADQDALTITQAAKTLGLKRERLTNWLHANGWSYRQNGSWLAYQPHINNGRLQYKEARYSDANTGQECIKPYFHILPKGLAKLAEVFAVTEAA